MGVTPSDDVLAGCDVYESLPGGLKRYFCGRCGCHLLGWDGGSEMWHFARGVVEGEEGLGGGRGEEGGEGHGEVVRLGAHIFVGDTVDGGVVGRLLNVGGRGVEAYEGWEGAESLDKGRVLRMAEGEGAGLVEPGKDESVAVRCHCGGVDLKVRRAGYAEDKQGVDDNYIPPEKNKYIAGFCACRSCRLSNGVASLQPWMYVPPINVKIASTGKRVVFGRQAEDGHANEGTTLKHFWSSGDVCRSFCGSCCATVFYWCDDRPAVVDIAVGLVRAEEGAMARRWLWWRWDKVSWAEEAVEKDVLQAILSREGNMS